MRQSAALVAAPIELALGKSHRVKQGVGEAGVLDFGPLFTRATGLQNLAQAFIQRVARFFGQVGDDALFGIKLFVGFGGS